MPHIKEVYKTIYVDKIYIYRSLDGASYQLSYGEITNTDWEFLGTFDEYDIATELLSYNYQREETIYYYREYKREFNYGIHQYTDWVATDNLIDADRQVGDSNTSKWVLEPINEIVTYDYEALNYYSIMGFFIPENKGEEDMVLANSLIYIGLDNGSEKLEACDMTWANRGNLDDYVYENTNGIKRSK